MVVGAKCYRLVRDNQYPHFLIAIAETSVDGREGDKPVDVRPISSRKEGPFFFILFYYSRLLRRKAKALAQFIF